ncbi:hypothetical protein [Brachyspira innocens]|uniref:hypothetical protein n=1 Tax=Brachyspira innocens TaxID=13264 RepID=UPI0026EC93E8|nr:hypothetical protein [Brachyspira innocens]
MIVGNFEINVKQKNKISEELKDIFKKGTNLLGVHRELMLYLGKKESNSVDYAYISRTVPAVLNPAPRYELIIVNVPYDNSNMKNYKFNATTIIEDIGKGMLGGIRCSSAEEATIRILNSLEADRFIRTFNSAVDNTKKIEKGTEEEMALVKKVQEYHYDVELYLGYKPVAFANYYYIAEVKNRETEVKGIQLVTVNNPKEGSIIVEIKDIL